MSRSSKVQIQRRGGLEKGGGLDGAQGKAERLSEKEAT